MGMRAAGLAVPVVCAALAAASAQGYESPARGDPVRADLLDALRPLAEWALGAPVEFVVSDMRVAGDAAFASMRAQRPGGGDIALAETPMVTRDGAVPEMIDGPAIQALYVRSGRVWVAVLHEVGATDVWYANAAFCPLWAAVLPEYCPGG